MPDRDERHRARIEAERRRRRGRGPGPRHERAVQRRNVALTGVGVLALAVGGWALFVRDDGAPGDAKKPPKLAALTRQGSVVVPNAPDVAITSAPTSFRIVYRVEDRGPKEVTARTDIVSVRRPWESLLESKAGAPPGGKLLSTQSAAFGQRTNHNIGQDPAVITLGPVLPASDLRLDRVLDAAVAAGRAKRREVRTVAGRTCQVVRTGDYLAATQMTPPSAKQYADSCVDSAGLLLEEVLVSDGNPIARRVAVSVEEGVTLADDLFPTGKSTVPASKGGGTMRPIREGSTPPGPFFVADAIPDGFVSIGRYSVIPPQAENFSGDPERESFQRAMVSDVYLRGTDVLVIEQGATLRGADPYDVDPTNPTLDLGPFGTAEVRFSGHGTQVRAKREGGRFVQATGTLPPDELAAVLRSLREVPGGELQFAD